MVICMTTGSSEADQKPSQTGSKRIVTLVALAAVVFGASALEPQRAEAATPVSYRVCADVPWSKPSVAQQRKHLGKNARWPVGDRSNPSFYMDFPFVIRLRSGSISYDQNVLSGMWTLSRGSIKKLNRYCPFPGGRNRDFVVRFPGWSVKAIQRDQQGNLEAVGSTRPGRMQVVNIRGAMDRDGVDPPRLTMTTPDASSCFISAIGNYDDGIYRNISGANVRCQELAALVEVYSNSPKFEGQFGRFTCREGQSGYTGVQVTCFADNGAIVRMGVPTDNS